MESPPHLICKATLKLQQQQQDQEGSRCDPTWLPQLTSLLDDMEGEDPVQAFKGGGTRDARHELLFLHVLGTKKNSCMVSKSLLLTSPSS